MFGCVDTGSPDSVGYANAGNYGIAVGSPDHLAWPGGTPAVAGGVLPAGVDRAPPNALASFIRGMPEVEDKSGGQGLLFYAPNLGRLHEMPGHFAGSPQFRRWGPNLAQLLFGIPAQPPLE